MEGVSATWVRGVCPRYATHNELKRQIEVEGERMRKDLGL